MRAIDCGELEKRISSLARLARSDAKKSLLCRVLYIVENMPTLTPPNEPLTLEQLREMDGKPVWVERNESPHDGKWFIVDHADIENPDKTLYTKEGVTYSDYGAYFTAYTYPPAHIDREAWVSVEDRMPKYNIREDGELVSSKILVRCEIDKTVHLVVSKKFYTGRPGEMVHSVFRFYDEWGDIIENVSHWMPLPKPPRPR